MDKKNNTIFAPATLVGESSISVIRISGPDTFNIIHMIFARDRDNKTCVDISALPTHTLHHGFITDGEEMIDEVVLAVFKAPNSYTGEDVIELSSHGGRYNFHKINKLLIKQGCIHAEPGEFTRRAYMNGKLDLVQAESIADLIRAKTELASKAAFKQLSGDFSNVINKLREEMINYCSLVELELDFSEEGLEVISKLTLLDKINHIQEQIQYLLDSYDSGRIIMEGVNLTISGKPNVGKSTIFNYLLKQNRAIVTDIPGTTRDYLEESLIMEGLVFNLVDTAGIRETQDEIERLGVERTFQKMGEADIVIDVIDLTDKHRSFGVQRNGKSSQFIRVYNKLDKTRRELPEGELCVSALTGENMQFLQDRIVTEAKKLIHNEGISEIYLTNERHRDCLLKSCEYLVNSKKLIEHNSGNELISIEIREALKTLEEIIGKTTNVDILNNIFSKFCIGK